MSYQSKYNKYIQLIQKLDGGGERIVGQPINDEDWELVKTGKIITAKPNLVNSDHFAAFNFKVGDIVLINLSIDNNWSNRENLSYGEVFELARQRAHLHQYKYMNTQIEKPQIVRTILPYQQIGKFPYNPKTLKQLAVQNISVDTKLLVEEIQKKQNMIEQLSNSIPELNRELHEKQNMIEQLSNRIAELIREQGILHAEFLEKTNMTYEHYVDFSS